MAVHDAKNLGSLEGARIGVYIAWEAYFHLVETLAPQSFRIFFMSCQLLSPKLFDNIALRLGNVGPSLLCCCLFCSPLSPYGLIRRPLTEEIDFP